MIGFLLINWNEVHFRFAIQKNETSLLQYGGMTSLDVSACTAEYISKVFVQIKTHILLLNMRFATWIQNVEGLYVIIIRFWLNIMICRLVSLKGKCSSLLVFVLLTVCFMFYCYLNWKIFLFTGAKTWHAVLCVISELLFMSDFSCLLFFTPFCPKAQWSLHQNMGYTSVQLRAFLALT